MNVKTPTLFAAIVKPMDRKSIQGAVWGAIMLLCSAGVSYADGPCGPLRPPGQYGPYDYTNADDRATKLHIVEIAHYTPNVANLIRGHTDPRLGPDLDYTLRAFPNHHRALNSLLRLALRDKTTLIPGMHYSVECYFKRAIEFKAGDPIVHMLYGTYLFESGKQKEGLGEYDEALKLDPSNGNIHYNLGLLYFELKNYDKSMEEARKAYNLGFPLPGLKNKLMSVGKWKDG